MEKGSLIERRLDNAVFREIKKLNSKAFRGVAIGHDFSDIGDIVVADGVGDAPAIAWVKAINNFSCSGCEAVGARVTMLLPEDTKESFIKGCMAELRKLSERDGIQIAGGHTQVSAAVVSAIFTVEVFGKACGKYNNKKAIADGSSIVMCGYAGMLGTDLIIKNNSEVIANRFGNYFSKGYVFGTENCSISDAAKVVKQFETSVAKVANQFDMSAVSYMHDVSCGGVYAALWQLGRYADCGFIVNNDRIAIRQETIEICEALEKNPYLIDGTGGLLIVCNEPEELLAAFAENGIEARLIGRIGKSKERCVAFGDGELRTLAASVGDEVY